MASRILRAAALNFKNYAIPNGPAKQFLMTQNITSNFLKIPTPISDTIRSVSFLNKITGSDLWKACTSVSNAGKRRGRGRFGKNIKDLNRGQYIGQGKQNLILPGLNTRPKQGNDIKKIERGANDPAWDEKLANIRDMGRTRRRRFKPTHMERGYSGTRLAGRSIGAPDPIGQYSFDEFDTRCIEAKFVHVMRSYVGRYRRHSAFIVTGNGQGVLGFAYGKSIDPTAALRKAKNRAAQKLTTYPVCDGHTIYHDFYAQFGYTKMYVYKMPEGYGLQQTHRIIRTLCNLIGIKDLRVKIEGSTNPRNVVKAFLTGLLQQKTYDQLAEEKKLYLVEFDPRRLNFPRIVGIPSYCRTNAEVPADENLDFKQHIFGGKIPLKRPPRSSGFAKLSTYQTHLKKAEKKRVWPETKHYLRVRYGSKKLKSFLTDKYPEDSAESQ